MLTLGIQMLTGLGIGHSNVDLARHWTFEC